jgi:hypothetical protein
LAGDFITYFGPRKIFMSGIIMFCVQKELVRERSFVCKDLKKLVFFSQYIILFLIYLSHRIGAHSVASFSSKMYNMYSVPVVN